MKDKKLKIDTPWFRRWSESIGYDPDFEDMLDYGWSDEEITKFKNLVEKALTDGYTEDHIFGTLGGADLEEPNENIGAILAIDVLCSPGGLFKSTDESAKRFEEKVQEYIENNPNSELC